MSSVNSIGPVLGTRPPAALPPGSTLDGRYRVHQPIGEGGMGVVYEGQHLTLDVPVAIKLIRSDLQADPEVVRRFLNEATSAALLRSQYVARVHDAGQLPTGEPYLVMERLHGTGLDELIKHSGAQDPHFAAEIAVQVCLGLEEAHGAGLIHRDIKPGNLFLAQEPDGRWCTKILDFGISKRFKGTPSPRSTRPHESLGSPWYMSPEQMVDATEVDRRTDIWSLGVVLYELLTGTRPFDGTTVHQVCARVLTEPAPSLRSRRPTLPEGLEAIVHRCLQKTPDLRYANAGELAAELRVFADRSANRVDVAVDSGSLAPVLDEPSELPVQRLPVLPALGVALGLLVVALGVANPGWASAAFTPFERLTFPWDPALAVGPQPVRSEPAPRLPPPLPAEAVRSDPSAPADTSASARARGDANQEPTLDPTWSRAGEFVPSPAPALTPEEIERRKLRYERWLDEQNLERIE